MKTIAQQLNIKKFPFTIKDENGNPLYYEQDNEFWCKYKWNSDGKEISYINSNGEWRDNTYDSEGRLVDYEASTGYRFLKRYDENGNLVYQETQEVGDNPLFWIKRAFDEHNTEIYYEDSVGLIKDKRITCKPSYSKKIQKEKLMWPNPENKKEGDQIGVEVTVETKKKIIEIPLPTRDTMKWGTYGKSGKETLRWMLLRDMNNEHIMNILTTQNHISPEYRRNFMDELTLRFEKPELSLPENK